MKGRKKAKKKDKQKRRDNKGKGRDMREEDKRVDDLRTKVMICFTEPIGSAEHTLRNTNVCYWQFKVPFLMLTNVNVKHQHKP